MLDLLKLFITSQLFAVIVTVVLTFLSTIIIERIKFNRDEKIYLKRKRESLYQMMYDFAMRAEQDLREKKRYELSKATKDIWNEIQIQSIFGKHETMEYFYDLFEEIQNNFEQFNDEIKRLEENNKKILEFYRHIKNELGIKD